MSWQRHAEREGSAHMIARIFPRGAVLDSFGDDRMARTATATSTKKSAANSNTPQFSKEEELHAFREMLLIRRFEEKAGQMYGMGLIGGFCHLYLGQEAVVTG